MLIEELVRLFDLEGQIVFRSFELVRELVSYLGQSVGDVFGFGRHHLLEVFVLLLVLVELTDTFQVHLDA